MYHKEYINLVSNADTAILFIHGILGTPDHFDELIAMLPSSLSVYNVLLDGHGKLAKDFSKTSMEKWEKQIDTIVSKLLLLHGSVYIVAHSMGTLFAIEQAIKNPKVKGLFLLAVPILPMPKLQMFQNAFKVYRGNIRTDDIFGMSAKAACSIAQSKNPFHYVGWIFRYFELFHKIQKTKNLLPSLVTPTIAIQSQLDEMVSMNAGRYLKKYAKMSVYTLEKSYHYLYDSEDFCTVKSLFVSFTGKINGGKP